MKPHEQNELYGWAVPTVSRTSRDHFGSLSYSRESAGK